MTGFKKAMLGLTAAVALTALAGFGPPPKDITVGVLSYGTAQWEMKVIKDHSLDLKHHVNVTVRDMGGEDASNLAIQKGNVDVILSDWVWVSIQRNMGNQLTIVPNSLAVGGVMVNPDSGIGGVGDLAGKTVAVAGGPTDKSWIILQAYYNQETGNNLTSDVTSRFAAPPLTNELLQSGQIDAALNFWHYNARLKAAGMKQMISTTDLLDGLGLDSELPLLGWTFSDQTAQDMTDQIKGFLDASHDAKELMLTDDDVWDSLRDLMGAKDDDALFEQLKSDYRAGIIQHYDPSDTTAAQETFKLLAEYGGKDAVGDVPELADGTFWDGYSF